MNKPKTTLRKANRTLVPLLFCFFILLLSVRGLAGVPTAEELNSSKWKEEGPFELSPERGRFGLTYSIVEDRSVHFSIPLARFLTPDLGYWNERYVSLFAPGLSLLIIPGYVIGKLLGMTQVGATIVVALFAIGNSFLIKRIAETLGAETKAALLAGLVFLFATPAFTYAVSLYQHHVSTFLILLGLYIVMTFTHPWRSLFTIWFLCAASILIDYPNVFFMAPIGMVALFRLIDIQDVDTAHLKVIFYPSRIFTFTGFIIPVLMFAAFGYYSYGNSFQLAGSVPYVADIDASGKPVVPVDESGVEEFDYADLEASSTAGFFNPRNLVNGLYIHLISLDRGIITFTPVMVFGLFGAYWSLQQNKKHVQLLFAVAGINLILYSMWGDPWGGWAFGSRYLIPLYAILSIYIAIALTRFAGSKLFLFLFDIFMVYSISVNTLGALTTSANPPQIEAIPLQEVTGRIEKYSYDRNWEYLVSAGSKSFVYQEAASSYIGAPAYYFFVVACISIFALKILSTVYSLPQKTLAYQSDNIYGTHTI